MTMPSMTWNNGTTTYTLPLPDKDGIDEVPDFIGSRRRMLSGKTRIDSIAEKRIITVTWPYLFESERAALKTAYDACAGIASVLTLPDGLSATVLAKHNGWKPRRKFDVTDVPRYTVTLTFEEVG